MIESDFFQNQLLTKLKTVKFVMTQRQVVFYPFKNSFVPLNICIGNFKFEDFKVNTTSSGSVGNPFGGLTVS